MADNLLLHTPGKAFSVRYSVVHVESIPPTGTLARDMTCADTGYLRETFGLLRCWGIIYFKCDVMAMRFWQGSISLERKMMGFGIDREAEDISLAPTTDQAGKKFSETPTPSAR